MKLLSYMRCGQPGFGAVVENGVVDLTGVLRPGVISIRSLLAADLLEEAAAYLAGRSAQFARSDLTLLPVVPDPGKILCVGLNYEKHKAETGRPDVDHPTIFPRFADTQVAHRQAIVKPTVSHRLDFEGELAVVIGRGGRAIPVEAALRHVAGYACYNDGSIRDWQRHTAQFTPGKNFPGTGAFGPYLVTADEVGDYRKLHIQTRLNGTVMQDAALCDLLFSIETIIAYVSAFTPLSPGDVIVSGTPGGVGDKRTPPVYMVPGDTVEVDIPGVGTLVNTIIAEGQQ